MLPWFIIQGYVVSCKNIVFCFYNDNFVNLLLEVCHVATCNRAYPLVWSRVNLCWYSLINQDFIRLIFSYSIEEPIIVRLNS